MGMGWHGKDLGCLSIDAIELRTSQGHANAYLIL